MSGDFKNLEQAVGHSFADQNLLAEALTHSSTGKTKNYERLEFLGDRVLGLVIAQNLYHRFPKEAEGDMARRLAALVQGSLLAEIAEEINIGDYIRFSEAEKAAGGKDNDNILSDVFEALLGALYIDGGFEKCRALTEKHWAGRFDKMTQPPTHPKTNVQEWAQKKGLPLPAYEIQEQFGPDHAPVFVVKLTVKGYKPVLAEGRSRQAAERDAAQKFMENIDE